MNKKLEKIKEVWEAHKSSNFPSDCRGEEIEGIDLVMLDVDIAGCVTTYIGSKGVLEYQKIEILKKCREELNIVLSKLRGLSKEYYAHLNELVNLILEK